MASTVTHSIQYLDDVVSAETHEAICAKLEISSWQFGHGSVAEQARPFWKMILDQDAITDRIWAEAKPACETLADAELMVLRQYANGHTYGQGGMPHTDDTRDGSYTLLYYPMREWHTQWAGETVFYGPKGEVSHSVTPKPRRAVLFDARIPHAGLAPSQAFKGLRKTVAFKLIQKSVYEAQPLPSFKLERMICDPFDQAAQNASMADLKESLLAALAASFNGTIRPDFLANETQLIRQSLQHIKLSNLDGKTDGLSEQEIHEIAMQRLKSGMVILEHAKTLGLESGAPLTERRTIEALLRQAVITDKIVDRKLLLES
jgi:hypothetical protein